MSYQRGGHFQGNSPQGILLEMVEISKKEKNINYTYRLHCNLKHASGLCIQIAMAPPSSLWFYSMAPQPTEAAETPTASWSPVLTSFPAKKRWFYVCGFTPEPCSSDVRNSPSRVIVCSWQGFCEGKGRLQTRGGQLLLCSCDTRLQISAGKLSSQHRLKLKNPCSPSMAHYRCIDTTNKYSENLL